MFKMDGLKEMQDNLAALRKALEALDGTLGQVTCDADDDEDVERALQEMETIIDERVAPFRSNPAIRETVDEMTSAMKASYREQMLKAVDEKRKGGSGL